VLRQRDSSTEKEEPNHVREEEEEEEDAIGSSTSSDENRLELSLTFSKLIPLIWIRKIYIQYIMYKYTYFFLSQNPFSDFKCPVPDLDPTHPTAIINERYFYTPSFWKKVFIK
jgi:hypothetical protein